MYQYQANIDILYIKMNVYSSAIDVLEALNASADRIELIQARCTEIRPVVLRIVPRISDIN